MLSASSRIDSPASVDCFTPASTALLPCSVASTAAVVAFWMSLRIVRTCAVACLDCSAQTLDLLCHHRETFAVFTRFGRFNRRIDRQQIRLLGQIVNRRNDFANGLALLAELHHAFGNRLHLLLNPLHPVDGGIHRFPARLRHLGGFL